MNSWITLLLAGLCEVWWAVGMKYTHGFTRLVPSVVTIIGMIASFYFLAHAVHRLPLGVAYAIWTGIGAAGTVLIGIFVFGEPATFWRLFFITTLVASIVGLKLV